jgi:hypothetical protein
MALLHGGLYIPLETPVEAWPRLAMLRVVSETFCCIVKFVVLFVMFELWQKSCAQGKVAVVHPCRTTTRTSGMEKVSVANSISKVPAKAPIKVNE